MLHVARGLAARSSEAFQRLFDRSARYEELIKTVESLRVGFGHSDPSAISRVLHKQRREFEAIAALDFFPTAGARARAGGARATPTPACSKLLFPAQAQAALGAGRERCCGAPGRRASRLWADRLACAWLIRRFVDPEAHARLAREDGEALPDARIGFGFEGAHFANSETRVTYEEMLARLGLAKNPALAKIGSIVHFLEAGGTPVPEAAGVQTLLQGALRRAPSEDELLAEAEKTFDLLYEAYFEPPAQAPELAAWRPSSPGVLGAQLLQPRVDHRELVEVAVARGARELQLLDRRGQAALQDVDLGLRLVLQQPLAERGIGLRLQRVAARRRSG